MSRLQNIKDLLLVDSAAGGFKPHNVGKVYWLIEEVERLKAGKVQLLDFILEQDIPLPPCLRPENQEVPESIAKRSKEVRERVLRSGAQEK